jgi:tetratricopeptide (TPR) repeat protein/predicted Ser/Thr protein kinase
MAEKHDPPATTDRDPTEATAQGRRLRSVEIAVPPKPAAVECAERGTLIGRYVVLEALGEGGMGVVYKAFDPELDRRVALKCVRPQPDGTEDKSHGRERLLREAQALAQLSHPNVVSVHDVGTVDGDVFIAMELVEGLTLKSWLREQRRTEAEISSVFLAAGGGLAAAHRAGLVHRDFKPDNVIIGADGRVRVIDFGLARAPQLPADPGDRPASAPSRPRRDASEDDEVVSSSSSRGHLLSTPLTQVGSVVGTPPYMAPEQFRGEEVDALTDQFSYCVSLYEALYGQRPFRGNFEAIESAVLAGRIGPPPSEARVAPRLRKIIERGLSVDRSRRYPTMDALLVELAHDPRVVRRRWMLVAAVAGVAAASAFGFARFSARQHALCQGMNEQLTGVWDDDVRARVRDGFARSGRSYADDTFGRVARILDEYAAAWVGMSEESCTATRLRGQQSEELLDLRSSCLQRRRTELAALTQTLVKPSQETVDKAIRASLELTRLDGCADAQALRQAFPPPSDPTMRQAVREIRELVDRSKALRKTGNQKEGLAIAVRAVERANQVEYPPVRAEALEVLGRLQGASGLLDEEAKTWKETIGAASRARDDDILASAWTRLVQVNGESKPDQALSLDVFADAAVVRAGDQPAHRADLRNALAGAYKTLGRLKDARREYEEALKLAGQIRPPDPERVALAHVDLANMLDLLDEVQQARAHYEEGLEIWIRVLGPDHPEVAVANYNFGDFFLARGDYDQAWTRIDRARQIWERAFGPEYQHVATALLELSAILQSRGQYDEARADLERAKRIREKVYGADHPQTATIYNYLGLLLVTQRHYDDGRRYLERALEIRKQKLAPDAPNLAESYSSMGDLWLAEKRYAEARRAFAETRKVYQRGFGKEEHPEIALASVQLARCALAEGKPANAVEEAQPALAMLLRVGNPLQVATARYVLAQALWESGRDRTQAIALARQARDALRASSYQKDELREIEAWLSRR